MDNAAARKCPVQHCWTGHSMMDAVVTWIRERMRAVGERRMHTR